MACAAALGQLEASFAKLATETQRLIADRAAVEKTTERLRLFVEETKLGAEKAKVLNAELVQRLLQAKEDMRDTLQAAERLTLAYSDSAASLTFLTAQKKKLQREKEAATKIQAIQRGKTGRRKYAAKKRMVDALRLLDERRRQLLDKEMTLAPIRDDLTRKENDLATKVAEWKRQLMAVRQASDVELAPFRDTLKLEQTRVLALHSEMDSLRTLKSLDASRDVSREQLSMDAKQASQQAKQSERLQFPPLRVPAGTGSLEKSLSNLHSKSMSSLHRTLAPRKLKDVCGQPVR